MDTIARQVESLVPEVPELKDFDDVTTYLRKLHQHLLDISVVSQQNVEQFSYSTLRDEATPDVTNAHKHSYWVTGGTTTITNFLKGFHGQVITVVAEHSVTITDGTNIYLVKGANYDMTAKDSITLICKDDDKWYELGQSS